MEDNIIGKISSKYIIKLIFSHIKVRKSLQIIKLNKNLMDRIDIKLSHYQLYNLFSLFNQFKLNNIDDILDFPYLHLFPDDVICEAIYRYMKKEKLLQNYYYINIYDDKKISMIKKLIEKYKNEFKFIIGDIRSLKCYYIYGRVLYRDIVIKRISIDAIPIESILLNYLPLRDEINNYISIDFSKVKYLNLDYSSECELSSFNNLEYLLISRSTCSKLNLSENQYKNIKVLDMSKLLYKSPFENKNAFNSKEKKFQNLKELYIRENLLNNINFAQEKLKKLSILFDYRYFAYEIDYIKNYLNNIIKQYTSLDELKIEIFYCDNNLINYYNSFIEKMSDYYFNLIHNLSDISFKFYYLDSNDINKYEIENITISELLIKNIKNKKGKFMIKGKNVKTSLFEPYFNKIEEIELLQSYESSLSLLPSVKKVLLIEEVNSLSDITKLNLKFVNSCNKLEYIPIKSFSSLKYLKLEIFDKNLTINFPLFNNSLIKYDNLEYLSIDFGNVPLDNSIFENLTNIPNLKYLSIINKKIFQTNYPYRKVIISKCVFLKKLYTLIANGHGLANSELFYADKYYDDYPELKKTNIKFCYLSD